MNREPTDQDAEAFEGELEDRAVREELKVQYFAEDEYGTRRMSDPEYARLFRTGLQAALELQRSANGFAAEGSSFVAPREPTAAERAGWERLFFATEETTDPKTGEKRQGQRLISIDPEYRKRVEALGEKIFGSTRRDPTGRITG